MAIRKILKFPHPTLRKPTKNWLWIEGIPYSEFKQIEEDILDTLDNVDRGAALAANQIGIEYNIFGLSKQLAQELNLPRIIVNPEIMTRDPIKAADIEGCLSFPGMQFVVPRHVEITVSYEDLESRKILTSLKGFPARVFQHEIDHLQGKLFIDFLPKRQQYEIRSIMLKRG